MGLILYIFCLFYCGLGDLIAFGLGMNGINGLVYCGYCTETNLLIGSLNI